MVENTIFEMADIFGIGRQVKFLKWSVIKILENDQQSKFKNGQNVIFKMANISNFRIGRQVKFLSLPTAEILKFVNNWNSILYIGPIHGLYVKFNKFKIHNKKWEDTAPLSNFS